MLVNFLAEATLEHKHTKVAMPGHLALDRVAVIILGGGEGKRLAPLTQTRCKPTISFGGRYSLIDIPISHSLTTGLRNIFVIGQYLAYTLQKHLFQTYLYHGISQNQIQLLVPEERSGKRIWYQGTADAVRQNLEYFSQVAADYFLILSGDQLYNIDFRAMINFALTTKAGMVIAAQPVNKKNAKRMGLLQVEHGGTKLVDFVEKPQEDEVLKQFYTDDITLQGMGYEELNGKRYLGSMGIYLFKRQTLFDLLLKDNREDFGKHLISTQMKEGDVHAFLYDGYWEDIGTIESYFEANLALTEHSEDPRFGLQCYDERHVIMTKSYRLPGAQIAGTKVERSLICEGSWIHAKEVTHCVLGVRTVLEKGCVLRDTIVMGNEYYKRPPLVTGQAAMQPGIGENTLIEKAIIDENVKIGKNVKLINKSGHTHYDSPEGEPLIYVRDGIIVIPRGSHIPDGFEF